VTSFAADGWLSETIGRRAFKWTGAPADAAAVATDMRQLARGGDAFFFARTPTTDTDASRTLERAGFAVVDISITFAWTAEPRWPVTAATAAPARPDQHAAVIEIAGTSFTRSRFHLDSRVGKALADLVKRRWIENYCLGRRGAALYAAEIDGRVAGFLAVLTAPHAGKSTAVIDLIAVDPAFQGRGVGGALVRRFTDDWRPRVDELRVGTQAANVASMRFYEGVGFRTAESSLVLHAHVRQGEVWL
jgi:ribosomal protein S18 acetylase RimI-like enzyme